MKRGHGHCFLVWVSAHGFKVNSASLLSKRGHLEDVEAPRWQVEIEPSRHELASVAIIAGAPRLILESREVSRQAWKWKMDLALALVPRIVDGDQALQAIASAP